MQPRYLANQITNSLIAAMTCRKCKHDEPFEMQLEEVYLEESEEEAELTDQLLDIIGISDPDS